MAGPPSNACCTIRLKGIENTYQLILKWVMMGARVLLLRTRVNQTCCLQPAMGLSPPNDEIRVGDKSPASSADNNRSSTRIRSTASTQQATECIMGFHGV